ncbi:hypothetical protein NNO07_22475 [Pseudomonas resinovorans]|uniref:Phage tail protein n=1 Tax=Metapseudomonas resinovorans TaxID=53412 RepID=A0ABT4YAD9_METRE|nr:hypothetical protein [Pseudomonas resinovorans]MDA8485842.1 hypothetical protein [Pseudomonas resinovorans]
MTSFTKKQIEVRFTLGDGEFAAGGNTKIIKDLGVSCAIDKPGLPDKNKASLAIFGMLLDDMAQLTTLSFRPLQVQKNLIQVLAGENDQLSVVFAGEITTSFADFNSAPDVSLKVEAMAGYYPSITPAPPTTVRGSISVESIVGSIAKQIGYQFENHGVTASLLNPVLNGSPIEKARAACRNAGVQLFIDDNRLRIAPAEDFNGFGALVPLSPETGLIGYPTFGSEGIQLKAYFNNQLEQGGRLSVQSVVPRATGDWVITKLSHRIEANLPGSDNAWHSEIEASYGSNS